MAGGMTRMDEGDGRFADGAAYIEGKFVPIAEARIPILAAK